MIGLLGRLNRPNNPQNLSNLRNKSLSPLSRGQEQGQAGSGRACRVPGSLLPGKEGIARCFPHNYFIPVVRGSKCLYNNVMGQAKLYQHASCPISNAGVGTKIAADMCS